MPIDEEIQEQDPIHFIMTGGTIDSYYNGAFDTVEPREQSVIQQYMTRVHLQRTMKFSQVCMKDSRRLTDDDRKAVVEVIKNSDYRKFIITHGTYTLAETARFIQERLTADDADRTIVLTSATVPLEGVTMSNGGFNLGFRLRPTRSACTWSTYLRGLGTVCSTPINSQNC